MVTLALAPGPCCYLASFWSCLQAAQLRNHIPAMGIFWVTKATSHPNTLSRPLSKAKPGTERLSEGAVPLRGGVLAVEGVLQLDDVAVLLPQQSVLLRVVLHQLREGGELLPSVQVVVIPRVLDLDVCHLIVSPEEGKETRL